MDTSSGSALAPAGQQGAQWQIDIPSLSQMLLRIGADGLKRIQMSGVDLHTIGCLLALGEVSPASATFRKKLLSYRRIQRSRKWFLNAIIEYGSGTNTVVDQLLKTRSGENILSLVVAITSVLDEAATDVLMNVFELLHTPYDSVPGITQVQRVRSTCLSLARAADFKDRVARTHDLILRDCFVTKRVFIDQDALPDSITMAKLIVELKSHCLEGGPQRSRRLLYYGLIGAAWCVEYSKDVLGLDVCLVFHDGTVYPVSGNFTTAQVIVLPTLEPGMEIAQKLRKPTDFLLNSTRRHKSQAISWLRSCGQGNIDYFQLCCGWNLVDRQEVGNLIYSIAKSYIEYRLQSGTASDGDEVNTFYGSNMALFITNLQRTLYLLGLPERLSFPRRLETITLYNKLPEQQARADVDTWIVFEDVAVNGATCQLHNTVLSIAYRASCLAFTDWAEECRQLAFGAASYGRNYFAAMFPCVPGETQPSTANSNLERKNSLNTEILGMEIATFLTGSGAALERLEIPGRRFIGADLDGFLLVNYRAVEQSLRPGPIFIIREGQFLLDGEHRQAVREVPFYVATSRLTSGALVSLDPGCGRVALAPSNGYPTMANAATVEASLARNAIHLNYMVPYSEGLGIQSRVGGILDNLHLLKVTTPCHHEPDAPLYVQSEKLKLVSGKEELWLKDKRGYYWMVPLTPEASRIDPSPLENEPITLIYYLATANNPVAQWLVAANAACRTDRTLEQSFFYIIQQKCCLECTVAQATAGATKVLPGPVRKIAIIQGSGLV
ncbi:hypothetical protein ACCO45_000135 [Purpureocillium lilacinum]|uniref:Uncharacterized protein n=1 Tax=Purpureocillium lilacinum TaxID=33203 RepID=A0ACC4E662_PURLI